jgi:transposase
MAKPISDEKRADIVRHMEAGKSKGDIAEWLFVCIRTVTRVWNKFCATGSFAPDPQNSGMKPRVSEETMLRVEARVREVPDITLLELIEEFELPISQVALSKRLRKLGYTYKKKRSIRVVAAAKTSSRRGMRGRPPKRG